MSEMIRVLIVDDHKILQEGLIALLGSQDDIEVAGVADNGREGVEKTGELRPDVVLMDISMPVMNGMEATRIITERYEGVKVLVLTMHDTEEYVYKVFSMGASGCVTKKSAYQHLIAAIHAVHRGELYISPTISKSVLVDFLHYKSAQRKVSDRTVLTPREREILKLLVSGKKAKEIAFDLGISYKTVDTHKVHIFQKTGVHSVVDLTRYAINNNLIANEL
ncbi:response regulator transcription factor [bacterium]|nr:response regulator transcription factor [bacterium]